jgi:hypothetical protein
MDARDVTPELKPWTWRAESGPKDDRHAMFEEATGAFLVKGAGRVYEPLSMPNLPNALAQIRSMKEAERFLEGYGRLGFWEMAVRLGQDDALWEVYAPFVRRWVPSDVRGDPLSGGYRTGEPLGWMIAQGQTVDFALRLIDALQSRDDDDHLERLARVLRTRQAPGSPSVFGRPARGHRKHLHYLVCRGVSLSSAHIATVRTVVSPGGGLSFAFNAKRRQTQGDRTFMTGLDALWYEPRDYPLSRLDGDDDGTQALRDHAGRIVVDLVNFHTGGVVEKLSWSDGQFLPQPESGPLLRAVWHLVGLAAVKGQRIRYCKDCDAPFIAIPDDRRFCPPDPSRKQSPCLKRWRRREDYKARTEEAP